MDRMYRCYSTEGSPSTKELYLEEEDNDDEHVK
jgi:hypothetical protein